MTNELRRYRSKTTGEIVEYPDHAAAIFDDLVLVPSERAKDETEPVVVKNDEAPKTKKDGDNLDAK